MGLVNNYAAAFLIPFPLGVWRDELTVGEAGARAGIPEPQQRDDGSLPDVTVTPSGPQTPGTELQLQWVAPGFAPSAGYVVREASDNDWQGRDTPLLGVSGDALVADALGTTTRLLPHGVALPTGTRILTFQSTITGVSRSVSVAYRTPGATSWTTVTVASGLSTSYPVHPCLLVVEGSVLLFHWNVDTASTTAQIDVYQSLDGGATWRRYQRSVLPDVITAATATGAGTAGYLLGRLRGGYLRGQLFLSAHLTLANTSNTTDPNEVVRQYVSADRGATLVLVDEVGQMGRQDIAVWDGRLFFAYASTDQFAYCRVLANAWTPLSTVPDDADFQYTASVVSTVSGADPDIYFSDSADIALAVLEGGIYLLVRTADGDASCEIIRWAGTVTDRNIQPMGTGGAGSGYGAWWCQDLGSGAATDYPTQFCAWGWRGRIQVAYVPESSSGSFDDQLFLLELGGNATLNSPYNRRFHGDIYQAGWDRTYVPTSLPSVPRYGWTSTGAGTASITTTPSWLRLTTSASQRYFTYTVTSEPGEIRMGIFMRQVSGGAVSANTLACGLRWGGTGKGFQVEIRMSGTQARLRDVNGASDFATVTVDVSGGCYIMLAVSDSGNCTAGVAPLGEQHERKYQMLANGDAMTDDGGGGGTDCVFMFGHRGSGTATSEWAFVGIADDASFAAVTALGDGQDNPEDLQPIPTGLGVPNYAGESVYVLARGGPAWVGDQINIPAAAAYGARRALVRGWDGDARADRGGLYPSPATGFLGSVTGSPSDYRLPFRLPSRAEERIVRGFLALHLERPNFASVALQGYTGSAWSTLATCTCSVGSLSFARTGARVRPTAANATYLRTNELAGGYAILDDSLGTVRVRPILRNTSGPWGTGTVGPIPTIELDPDTVTGLDPSSGTLTIIYPRATLLLPRATTVSYAAYALLWSAAPAVTNCYVSSGDPNYAVGKAVIGELWAFEPTDWGMTRARESLTELTQLDNGRTTAKVKGPAARRYELPFTCARMESVAAGITTGSGWVLETGGATAGMTGQEAEILDGLLDELEGGAIPGVYVPVITKDGGTRTLLGAQAGIYGRMTSQDSTWNLEYGSEILGTWNGSRFVWQEER